MVNVKVIDHPTNIVFSDKNYSFLLPMTQKKAPSAFNQTAQIERSNLEMRQGRVLLGPISADAQAEMRNSSSHQQSAGEAAGQ